MIDLFENDENETHEESFGSVSSSSEVKKFMPWHKPRKQWVREELWWKFFRRLIRDNANQFSKDTSIKYFGLPGPELLDVDYLTEKMKSINAFNDKKLLIHGLVNSKNDKEVADSRLSELLDRDNVDQKSIVERLNFMSLEDTSSVLFKKMKSFAPYHFINLDFCDKVFEEKTISAVHNLLEYQFSALLDKPWLFCLTTKIDTEGNNAELLERLDTCLHSIGNDKLALYNLQEYFEPVFDAINKKESINTYENDVEKFTDIFLVGFVIWMVLLSLTHKVDFELESGAKYRVVNDNVVPDMYSFVFKFKKSHQPLGDLTGVAVGCVGEGCNVVNGKNPNEIIIQRLSKIIDLDNLLRKDAGLLQRYIDETKSLLSSCGWDVTNYEHYMCS